MGAYGITLSDWQLHDWIPHCTQLTCVDLSINALRNGDALQDGVNLRHIDFPPHLTRFDLAHNRLSGVLSKRNRDCALISMFMQMNGLTLSGTSFKDLVRPIPLQYMAAPRY